MLTTPLRRSLTLAVAALMLALAPAQAADHPDGPPATVYEEPDIPPQAMDYDAENQLFKAHPGWLNDKLVHYYKFRMYVPGNYGTGPDNLAVPVAPLYIPTMDLTDPFNNLVEDQLPILRYHTADGTSYSDFVQIVWVDPNFSYSSNDFSSYQEIEEAVDLGRAQLVESDIYVNMPLVPTGSRLEAPGGGIAPIEPVMAWFDGHEVQTFTFETTSADFAAHYNPLTRTGDATAAGSGFEMVVADFVNNGAVSFIPIWHINQFFTGVTPGQNSGGPADMGQRNVIDKDRLDDGYSPLWQVFWVNRLPVGYEVNQASHAAQFTEANGFGVMGTPMLVNCPNIGPHGGADVNPDKVDSFDAMPEVSGETVSLEGSLIMQGGKKVSARVGGEEVATATSGMMGAYSLEVPLSALADGHNDIVVVYDDADAGPHTNGQEVTTFQVMNAGTPEPASTSSLVWVVVIGGALIIGYLYMSRKKEE
ncbi:MAG: hypothetical protein ACPGQL_04230 [Thermoplasmatota archaeon]